MIQNFFYYDTFFNSVEEFLDYQGYEFEDLDDEYKFELTKPFHPFKFDKEKLINLAYKYLDNESQNNTELSILEDMDEAFSDLKRSLYLAYDVFEKNLPMYYEPNGKYVTLTKEQLKEYF